jgi:hypothetical protein
VVIFCGVNTHNCTLIRFAAYLCHAADVLGANAVVGGEGHRGTRLILNLPKSGALQYWKLMNIPEW